MFKPISAIIALTLCTLLIIFSPVALSAAKEGLELWLQVVLPTLFPFFVCVRLIERSGFIGWMAKKLQFLSHKLHLPIYVIPVALLSLLGGYPCGPRLCAMLYQEKCMDKETADRLGIYCNLCSPVFLLSALSLGMFHNSSFFPVIAISHYGGAILSAFIWNLIFPVKKNKSASFHLSPGISFSKSLPSAISEGISSMLQVGGCIIFFMVLLQLIDATDFFHLFVLQTKKTQTPIISPDIITAFFHGIFEMTNGCYSLAHLSFPTPVILALCSFFVSFGGLCIMFQAISFLPFDRPIHYLGYKLFHGTIAAISAYFLSTVFFVPVTETLYIALQTEQSSLQSIGVILTCAIIGLLVSLLIGMIGSKFSHSRKRKASAVMQKL